MTATQNYILEQYRKQDLQFEESFYNDVRDEELFFLHFESILFYLKLIQSHIFQEKRLEQWKSFLARTSKYPLLMVAKDSQNESIRQSRPEEKSYVGYHTVHNLEIPNLSITVSGRYPIYFR